MLFVIDSLKNNRFKVIIFIMASSALIYLAEEGSIFFFLIFQFFSPKRGEAWAPLLLPTSV